ncbi:hypothetical protein M199_gp098 [Halogranum tailed virus 1]|uniref:DUF1292 domain-containing protein n=1 Tax=Halogranum tailed virus 1 TaxID=1273749 RepID=R4TMZ1_9CAUD|nr:hypothetical protein M199_gp098 [Halogranum tailed virus 1]AGM11568.1 hypothetical protein HGTV1_271 [Halogranum tailed virus 1]
MATTANNNSSDEVQYEPLVMLTVEPDGTGRFTVSVDEEDHRFEVVAEAGSVEIEYIETLSWRGQIRTSDPDDEVYDVLTSSEEFQDFVQGVLN